MIVDLHTHVVPDNFPAVGSRRAAAKWPLMDPIDATSSKVMIGGANFRTVTDQCWSGARRMADMQTDGVDVQVISPMPELLSYWFEPEDARDFGRYVNQYIAGLVQAQPGRFIGLGSVPLQDPDLAAAEIAGVKAMGLAGLEIGSNVEGVSLGDPRYLDFFKEAERQEVPVFVHALHPTIADRYVGGGPVDNALGFPTDTCITIVSLITGGILEACPNLRLAFSHGGGTFPFMLPRLENAWSSGWNGGPAAGPSNPFRDAHPHSPADYARRLYYDSLLFDGRAIRYLVDMVGASQVVVGTDYPFFPREAPVDHTLRTIGLTAAELEAISATNCYRFLGLPVPAGVS